MKRLFLLALFPVALFGQGIEYGRIRVIPLGSTATGEIDFSAQNNGHYVGLKAPSTIGTSLAWTLPATDGAGGSALCTYGNTILYWCAGGGSLAPPISISASTGSYIMQLTQLNTSSAAEALDVEGSPPGVLASVYNASQVNGAVGLLVSATQNSSSGYTTVYGIKATMTAPGTGFPLGSVPPATVYASFGGGGAGTGAAIEAANSSAAANAVYAHSNSTLAPALLVQTTASSGGLAAEFSGGVSFDSGYTTSFNGSLGGTHAQNLGTSDSPTFHALTVTSCTGCGGGGGVTSLTAGSGISVSASTGAVTVSCTGCGGGSYSGGTGVTISGTTISIGQAVGTSSAVTFGSVTSPNFMASGWNYNNFGAGTWTASSYYVGATAGISSSTCSAWTSGLCTSP